MKADGSNGDYLDRLMRDLHERLDQQGLVVRELLRSSQGGAPVRVSCPLASCGRLEELRSLIWETIEALELTRRSFKSKQLEVIRKKLTNAVAGR